MSSDALNMIASVISALAFSAALVGALTMPSRRGGFMRPGMKMLLGGAMAIYLFVALSHILQFARVTDAFDIFENYLKVLFIPLIAGAAYSLRMNEQLRFTERQARVLSAEHDMLMRIVDTTPTGMVVLDATGHIEFANEQAKDILELEEDPQTSSFRPAQWTCGDGGACKQGDLRCCLGSDVVRDSACSLRWPDGRTRDIVINATPIVAADGSIVGTVAAFTAPRASAIA